MTEAEWLGCEDPLRLLVFLGRRGTQRNLRLGSIERSLRLFAVACCQRIWPLISSDHSQNAVVVAERYADEQAPEEELRAAESKACVSWLASAADDARLACYHTCAKDMAGLHVNHVSTAVLSTVFTRQQVEANWPVDPVVAHTAGACPEEEREQARILRCIFGNPFRPVAFDPAWRTDTAVTLARQMYEAREFSAMPILADALQDAGCEHPDILDHCRGPGPHVRGCWVIDLVLRKG